MKWKRSQMELGWLGVALSPLVVGVVLRLWAHDFAWPAQWKYNGARENTSWAQAEAAYVDVSYVLMALGVLLLVMIAHKTFPERSGDLRDRPVRNPRERVARPVG